MSRTRSKALAAIVAGVAGALVMAQPVTATPPSTAAGAGSITSAVTTPQKVADGNVFVHNVFSGSVTGTFTGTVVAETDQVFHKSGDSNFQGSLTFTGSVAGCGAGTIVFNVVGGGVAPIFEGHATSLGSSVHAVLDFTLAGFTVTYSGKYHC